MEKRNCVAVFQLSFDLVGGGASWLCDVLVVAIFVGIKGGFKRKFRGNMYTPLVERLVKDRGVFLKIMKVQGGFIRKIFFWGEDLEVDGRRNY